MYRSFLRPFSLACVALCVFTIGCGGGLTKVTGKVVKGGEPVKVSDKGMVQLTLVKVDDTSHTYPAQVAADGSFTVLADKSRPILPGTYKVAVTANDPYPMGKDVLNGLFTLERTKITREVGGAELTIDLAKP